MRKSFSTDEIIISLKDYLLFIYLNIQQKGQSFPWCSI